MILDKVYSVTLDCLCIEGYGGILRNNRLYGIRATLLLSNSGIVSGARSRPDEVSAKVTVELGRQHRQLSYWATNGRWEGVAPRI